MNVKELMTGAKYFLLKIMDLIGEEDRYLLGKNCYNVILKRRFPYMMLLFRFRKENDWSIDEEHHEDTSD